MRIHTSEFIIISSGHKFQVPNLSTMDNSEDEIANIGAISSDAEKKAQRKQPWKCFIDIDRDYNGT